MNTKKIISIVVSAVLVLSLATVVFAVGISLQQNSETEEMVAVHKFENTYRKLKVDKKLNIACIGGSITQGVCATDEANRSWPAHIFNWFQKKFPDAKINGINAGIGSTGSVFGKYRIVQDFKLASETEKPDLIFLEFAINDNYDGQTEAQIKKNMNSILKSIYQYAPNADVMILLSTSVGKEEEIVISGDNLSSQQVHEAVAAAYGIPTLDIGGMLHDKIVAEVGEFLTTKELLQNQVWNRFFADKVHPNDVGYAKYAGYITYYLDVIFSKKTRVADEIKAAYIPENADELFGEPLENPHYSTLKGQASPTGFWINGEGGIVTSTADSSFKIQFEGTSLALWTRFSNTAGVITITVDEEEPVIISLLRTDPYPTIWHAIENLEDTIHEATITVSASSAGSDVTIDRFCLTGSNAASAVILQ